MGFAGSAGICMLARVETCIYFAGKHIVSGLISPADAGLLWEKNIVPWLISPDWNQPTNTHVEWHKHTSCRRSIVPLLILLLLSLITSFGVKMRGPGRVPHFTSSGWDLEAALPIDRFPISFILHGMKGIFYLQKSCTAPADGDEPAAVTSFVPLAWATF